MKYMTINNRKVAFDDEKNVLSVIRKAGINLPTFCYIRNFPPMEPVVCV